MTTKRECPVAGIEFDDMDCADLRAIGLACDSCPNRAPSHEAELREALIACRNIISQNRGLTLCQGSEWVYLLDKIDAALQKVGEV
jgi:hypothetical protein